MSDISRFKLEIRARRATDMEWAKLHIRLSLMLEGTPFDAYLEDWNGDGWTKSRAQQEAESDD